MKPKCLKLLLTAFTMTLAVSLGAQSLTTVRGTVTDASTGDPLIGVGVMEHGNTINGVVSDLDGNFSIGVPENATLDFSCIGYDGVSEPISGRQILNVKMSPSAEFLEETVVIGYAVMKKRDVNGSVSKVTGDALTSIPLTSNEQALQGRVAGMQVSAATGAPGSDISVRIRGVGSIYSDNAPLYIIDGIPSSDGLNRISPNDIESISVLKDASSAAIYGSRATNGVVLITTKQGQTGTARVSYNGTFNVQQVVNLIDMCNTAEYVTLYNEAANNDNATSTIKRSLITDDMLSSLDDVDYLSEIFHIAVMHTHELSISGGTDKINYLVSGSYFDQDGIINNSGYNRGILRANVTAKAKDWLRVGMNVNGSVSKTNSISSSGDGYNNSYGGSVVRYALFRTPAIPIRDADGNYIDRPSTYFGSSVYDTFFGDGYNPVALAEYTDWTEDIKTLFAKANLDIILPVGLDLNTNFGVDYRSEEEKIYNTNWGDNNRINNPNSISLTNTENLNWTLNTTLNWNMEFASGHNVSALLGFEAIKEHGKTTNNSDQNFPIWDKSLIYIGNGLGEKVSSSNEWCNTLASFYLAVNWNWKNRYFISATVREDGTSKFIGKNRWGTFYAVSAGWTISNEKFMASQNVFSHLKLRVGYGEIGNQNVGAYAYSDHYASDYDYPFGSTSANGYAQNQLGNDDLKWETSRQFNVGLDMEFLKGSLGATVDFYNKTTADMLMLASYPPSSGNASSPWINNGKVLNRGVDLEIFYHGLFRNGGFDITLNGGYLFNKVLDINSPISSGRVDTGIYATLTEKGYPIGSFYMYVMDGVFQDNIEILTSAYQGDGIVPGDTKYKDINGDGIIDSNDRTHVGSSIPKFTLGLNLSVNWKGFDLAAFFQGAFGNKIYNQVLTDIEGFYRGFNVTKRYYDNRWTEDNPSNTYPRASWNSKSNNAKVSTRFLEDGSYLRLKNLQLGYSIPFKNFKGIERLRVYLAVTNLFTISKYSGLDPEMTVSLNSTSEGDRAYGIDWGTYPTSRMYTIGLNITL